MDVLSEATEFSSSANERRCHVHSSCLRLRAPDPPSSANRSSGAAAGFFKTALIKCIISSGAEYRRRVKGPSESRRRDSRARQVRGLVEAPCWTGLRPYVATCSRSAGQVPPREDVTVAPPPSYRTLSDKASADTRLPGLLKGRHAAEETAGGWNKVQRAPQESLICLFIGFVLVY